LWRKARNWWELGTTGDVIVKIGREELVPKMHPNVLKVWMNGGRKREYGICIHPLRDKEGVLREGSIVRTNTAAFVDPDIKERWEEGGTTVRRRAIQGRRDRWQRDS
jgi:hypothetical protein